jgi:hypothetical protein
MMALFFGNGGDLIGKLHRLRVILEFKGTLKAQDAILRYGMPLRNMKFHILDFGIGQGGFSSAAGNTFSGSKVDHFEPPFESSFSPQWMAIVPNMNR